MSDEGYEKSRKKYVVGIIAVVCVALLVVSFLVLPAYASEIAETDGTVTVADTGIEGTTEEVSTVAGTDSASNIQGGGTTATTSEDRDDTVVTEATDETEEKSDVDAVSSTEEKSDVDAVSSAQAEEKSDVDAVSSAEVPESASRSEESSSAETSEASNEDDNIISYSESVVNPKLNGDESTTESTTSTETTYNLNFKSYSDYVLSVAPQDGVSSTGETVSTAQFTVTTELFELALQMKSKITVQDITSGTQISDSSDAYVGPKPEDGTTNSYYSFVYKFPDNFVLDMTMDEGGNFYVSGHNGDAAYQVGTYRFLKQNNKFYLVINYLVSYVQPYVENNEGSKELEALFYFTGGISKKTVIEKKVWSVPFKSEAEPTVIVLEDKRLHNTDSDDYFNDISVKKSGTYNINDDTLTYTVEVSSDKGTPSNIQFADKLTWPKVNGEDAMGVTLKSVSYKTFIPDKTTSDTTTSGTTTSDIVLSSVPLAEDGSTPTSGVTTSSTTDASGNTSTDYTVNNVDTYYCRCDNAKKSASLYINLPQLEAGGKHTVTYIYQLNIDNTKNNAGWISISDDVKNTVTVKSVDKPEDGYRDLTISASATAKVLINRKLLYKTMSLYTEDGTTTTDYWDDSDTGVYTWTISINESHFDIAGARLVDTLHQAGKTTEDVFGTNTIIYQLSIKKRADGGTWDDAVEGTDFAYVDKDSGKCNSIEFLGSTNTNEFQITYKANVERDDKETLSNYNMAQLILKDDVTYSSTRTGYLPAKSNRVTKKVIGATLKSVKSYEIAQENQTYDTDGNALISWEVTVKASESKNLSPSLLFADVFKNSDGKVSDAHYMTQKQIEKVYAQVGNSSNALLKDVTEDSFYVLVCEKDIQSYDVNNLPYGATTFGGENKYNDFTMDEGYKVWIVPYKSLVDGAIGLRTGVSVETIKYHGFGFKRSAATSVLAVGSYSMTYETTGDMSTVSKSTTLKNYSGMESRSASGDVAVTVYPEGKKLDVQKYTITTTGEKTRDMTLKPEEMELSSNKVYWAIYVTQDENSSNQITVVDTLPKGLKLESLWMGWNSTKSPDATNPESKSGASQIKQVDGDEQRYSGYWQGISAEATLVKNEDGTQTMTINFTAEDGASDQMDWTNKKSWFFAGAANPLRVTYICTLDQDSLEEYDNYPGIGEKKTIRLNNTAKAYYTGQEKFATSSSALVNLTVNREEEEKVLLDKTGVWNNGNHTLEYIIAANPNAVDVDFTSGLSQLELVDVLSYNKKLFSLVSLDLDSVQLYYADSVTKNSDGTYDFSNAKEVNSLKWELKNVEEGVSSTDADTKTSTMTVSIPNETSVILKYDYKVQMNGTGTMEGISNQAYIQGMHKEYYEEVSGSSWSYSNSGVVVTLSNSYTFYKVDSKNLKVGLSGAKFGLYEYTNGAWSSDPVKTFTSNDGKIADISVNDFTEETYAEDTAYYLVEMEAPTGYVLPDNPTKYYFYYHNTTSGTSSTSTTSESSSASESSSTSSVSESSSTSTTSGTYPTGWGETTSTEYKNVVNIYTDDATAYVKNSCITTSVTVNKTWTGKDPQASLNVYLKQYAVSESAVEEQLGTDELTAGNLQKALQAVVYEELKEKELKGEKLQPDALIETAKTDRELEEEQDASVSDNVTQVDWKKVVLNSKDNWTYKWEDLPVFTYKETTQTAEDGTTTKGTTKVYYYYLVQEGTASGWEADRSEALTSREVSTDVDGTNITQTYSTVYPATITYSLTNTYYTLPAAGGIGDGLFYIVGGMLATLAMLACVFRKKK